MSGKMPQPSFNGYIYLHGFTKAISGTKYHFQTFCLCKPLSYYLRNKRVEDNAPKVYAQLHEMSFFLCWACLNYQVQCTFSPDGT